MKTSLQNFPNRYGICEDSSSALLVCDTTRRPTVATIYWRLPGRTPDLTRALAERYARHPRWRDILALVALVAPVVDGNDRRATARGALGDLGAVSAFFAELVEAAAFVGEGALGGL